MSNIINTINTINKGILIIMDINNNKFIMNNNHSNNTKGSEPSWDVIESYFKNCLVTNGNVDSCNCTHVVREGFLTQLKSSLKIGVKLNDEVINRYILLINKVDRCHAFGSYFNTKLSDVGPPGVCNWGGKAKQVRNLFLSLNKEIFFLFNIRLNGWSKQIDIFTKEFVFIPIHHPQNMHWTLAVIKISEKCIEHYDSIGGYGCLELFEVCHHH
jgi:hypothetical protein